MLADHQADRRRPHVENHCSSARLYLINLEAIPYTTLHNSLKITLSTVKQSINLQMVTAGTDAIVI